MNINEFKRIISKDPNNNIGENENRVFAFKKAKNFGGMQKIAVFSKNTKKDYFSDHFWCEEDKHGNIKEYCNINGSKTLVI